MRKITRKHLIFLLIGFILLAALLATTAKISYYLGERRISELVLHSDVPGEKHVPTTNYTEAVEQLRAERDQLSNEYDSACQNYQKLYDAYDKLYAKAGASADHEKIVRPDSARGNEVSCYR